MRDRPRGGWTASQYRWVPIERLGPLEPVDPPAARAALARPVAAGVRPGTEADIRWWTGWTARDARAALAAVPHVAVEVESGTGYVLADDVDPEPPATRRRPAPGARPDHHGLEGARLVPRATCDVALRPERQRGPDGVVGRTRHRRMGAAEEGELAYRLLEDVGADAETAVAMEAESLADWLGDVRITPRFRTPLERELAA